MTSLSAPIPDDPPPVDLQTARTLLGGVSIQTIYRLIQDGELELVKIRRRSFVTRRSINAVINSAERDGTGS